MDTLVTGGTGLLGNNVVRRLLERGQSVRVLMRQRSDSRPFDGLDVETVTTDIRNVDQVRRACKGVDTVIHSAGWVHIGWSGGQMAREVNVTGTRNVAQAAQAASARMIHVSTVNTLGIGAEDKPATEDSPRVGQVPCPYMVTKRLGEDIVRKGITQGLDAVIVHPGFMLGPWDWKPSSGRMVLAVTERFTPAAPRGGCSVCDVRDVADGILLAIAKGRSGDNYILAGDNMTYFDFWKAIARIAGTKGPSYRFGPFARILSGIYGRTVTALGGREPDVNSAALRVSMQYHYYDSGRAESELGYRNRPAEEAIQSAWEWFQSHGYTSHGYIRSRAG